MANKSSLGRKRTSRYRDAISLINWERNEFRRKVLLVSYLFESLSKAGVTAYLVGGQAVELYTGGQFATGDVGITTSDRAATEKVLREFGFAKIGMIWLREDIGIAVQIVDSYPSRTEKARTITVNRRKVMVVGVEDLIIDRLVAAKYWRSNEKVDVEQATVLLRQFINSLDRAYLRSRAAEEKVTDYLRSISASLTRRATH